MVTSFSLDPSFVPKYHADLQLDGVEFSTLPSGLHLVDRDVVYVLLLSPISYSQTSLAVTLQKTVTQAFVFFVVGARRNTVNVVSDFPLWAYYSSIQPGQDPGDTWMPSRPSSTLCIPPWRAEAYSNPSNPTGSPHKHSSRNARFEGRISAALENGTGGVTNSIT